MSQPLHTTVTLRKLNSIKNTLNSIVMYLEEIVTSYTSHNAAMNWSYDARINHEVKVAFIEDVRLHKARLMCSSNFYIHHCAEELVYTASTLENSCASIRRFLGSLMAFDEILEDRYRYQRSRLLFSMTNWACHGKYEKLIEARMSQPVPTTVTLQKLNFIKYNLKSIVMYLARDMLTLNTQAREISTQGMEISPQSGDVYEFQVSEMHKQDSGLVLIDELQLQHADTTIDEDDAWNLFDDMQLEEDWATLDCAAGFKWYQRAWYWFRSWLM
jgi:hypothetical protein